MNRKYTILILYSYIILYVAYSDCSYNQRNRELFKSITIVRITVTI